MSCIEYVLKNIDTTNVRLSFRTYDFRDSKNILKLAKFKEVKKLEINHKELLTSDNIRQFPQINSLAMRDLQVSELPSEIQNLKQLTDLDIRGNCLDVFPKFLEKMEQLTLIKIKRNPFVKKQQGVNTQIYECNQVYIKRK